MNKLQRKIIHTMTNGEVLVHFPDLNQAVLIGRPNHNMHDSPLTAAVITDLDELAKLTEQGDVPNSRIAQLVHVTTP